MRGSERRDDDGRKDYSIHGILGGKSFVLFLLYSHLKVYVYTQDWNRKNDMILFKWVSETANRWNVKVNAKGLVGLHYRFVLFRLNGPTKSFLLNPMSFYVQVYSLPHTFEYEIDEFDIFDVWMGMKRDLYLNERIYYYYFSFSINTHLSAWGGFSLFTTHNQSRLVRRYIRTVAQSYYIYIYYIKRLLDFDSIVWLEIIILVPFLLCCPLRLLFGMVGPFSSFLIPHSLGQY